MHHAAQPAAPSAADRVLVLAHRGAPGPQGADNTAAAVTAALARGADGVEVDVRLSADGELVCTHDPILRTSSGVYEVARASWSTLRLDTLPGGHSPACLQDLVLAAVRAGAHRVVVEAKPVASAAAALATAGALRDALGAVMARTGVTVSSFDTDLLAAVRHTCPPAVRTALLGAAHVPPLALVRRALDGGHSEVHPALEALRRDPRAVQTAHRVGIGVATWTVNHAVDLRWAGDLGVDAVITDEVATARAALATLPAAA